MLRIYAEALDILRVRLNMYLVMLNDRLVLSRTLGDEAFLQRVSMTSYAERCISYSKSVRLSVCLSVTRWH